MTKTSEIRKRFKSQWPGLRFIMLTDPAFHRWTSSDLSEFVENSKAGQNEFVENWNACEESAIHMLWEAKQIYPGEPVNKALWIVFALKTEITKDLPDPRHYLCLADTDSGLKMVDPRSKQIWSPTNEDEIIFLFG